MFKTSFNLKAETGRIKTTVKVIKYENVLQLARHVSENRTNKIPENLR